MGRRSRAGGKPIKRRRKAAAPRRPSAPKAGGRRNPSSRSSNTKIALLERERDEALEQQKATAEVLRVISASPGDLKPVFDAILENATRICEAKFGVLQLSDGDGFRAVALHDVPPAYAEAMQRDPVFRPIAGHPLDRLANSKEVVHIPDVRAEQKMRGRMIALAGARTLLLVPMLKDNVLIGIISIYRQEVRPFADKQIDLVRSFAAQAVIAIENTRLLNELRQRTDDLSELLEQQTATSEVLKVISSSPGKLEPVFQAMLENAVRICGANFGVLFLREGNALRRMAMHNPPPAYVEEHRRDPLARPSASSAHGRLIATKRVVHIADLSADEAYRDGAPTTVLLVEAAGARSYLGVPMLQDDELIGTIIIYRQEVRPFTDKQIALVENFAAQAVIAIENTRLLNELRQSLEQQTATAEVLSVISSSPGDLEPVFQAMLENATRVCDAKFGTLIRFDGEYCHVAAQVATPPEYAEYNRRRGPYKPTPGGLLDSVIRTKREHHTADATADVVPAASATLGGARTRLVVPMLKEDVLIGAISIYRQEVRPFTEKQIELVKNFAAQAVIAIENTRLLNELRQRTDDLTELLEQQTATSECYGSLVRHPASWSRFFRPC